MSAWRANSLTLPWGQLNVWTAGKGPIVIALHGLGGSGRYWHGLARGLDDRFTLVAPDLFGFGRSDKPVLRYDRAFHLESLASLVERYGEVPVIVGHSVGAVLAALWAATHPDQTAGLGVISAPFPRASLMPSPALRLARSDPEDRGRLASGIFRTVWPAVSVAARLTRRFPPGLVGDYGRQSLGARADTMWTTLADPTVTDDLMALADVSSRWPSLLMSAADDRYIGSADIENWQRFLPNADRIIAPAGGHQFLIRTGFDPLAAWIKGL